MAHEVETMAYVGETPWHGLGTKLNAPPSIEEAITASGLDWEVRLEELMLRDVPLDLTGPIPARAVMRQTDRKVLGVVGTSYRPLQNREAFRFFQPFVDAGHAEIHTAGSLRGGRKVWVLAKLAKFEAEVVPGDSVQAYILLSNSHDGSATVKAGFTPIRVVCNNTLSAAEGHGANLLNIRHTKNVDAALEIVRGTMDLMTRAFRATTEQYRLLAHYGISQTDLRDYVARVYETPDEKALDRRMEVLQPIYEGGLGMEAAGHDNLWRAYNAITEQTSWHRGNDQDVRMDNVWFGAGKALNDRALGIAVTMAVGGPQ